MPANPEQDRKTDDGQAQPIQPGPGRLAWLRSRASLKAAKAGRMSGTIQFARNAALEAQRTRLPQMAAALSYRTIFGLIPVLFVALIALKMFFVTDDEIGEALSSALEYSGLSSIRVHEIPPSAMMGPFPEHLGPPPTEVEAEKTQAHLDEWITTLVQRVGTINFRAVSIIGLIALLYAAIAMLVEIERSFNQVYRVPVGRSWPRRIAQYWTLLTLGTIFLAATFYIGQQASAWIAQSAADHEWAAAWTPGQSEEGHRRTALIALGGYLATVSVSTVLLLLAYTIVPNTRVRLFPALGGALVAAVLWEAGKWGFTQYLAYSAGYARLYGSIALIPLFLLWVYVTWLVVLMGLSVSYYLQHGRRQAKAAAAEAAAMVGTPSPTIVDPGAILALMLLLARQFERDGRPVELATLADELALDRGLAAQMLERLMAAGFVHRVLSTEQPTLNGALLPNTPFVLARPPQQIDAESVLDLAEGLVCPLGKTVVQVSSCMKRARHSAVRGRSLADFSRDPEGSAVLETLSAGPATV